MLRPLLIQLFVTTLGLPLLAAWPPAEGRILLVPLTTDAAHSLAARALDADARLVSNGPVRGSLVVEGRAAALRGIDGTVAVAAAAAGCGKPTA